MKITTIIAATLGFAVGLAGIAGAQALIDAKPPAEVPPASYKSRQYVDSRGCIYVRAGIDNNVTWVPRVDRTRRHLCGYEPTFKGAELARTRPPTAANGGGPEILTLGPTPRRAAPQQAVPAPVVAPVAAAAPKPAPAARATKPVRQQVQQPAVSTRVVPLHVYEARQNTRNVSVPKGYRQVWTDDRLNPYRAERTLQPSLVTLAPKVPRGYRRAWQDDRLNTRRADVTRGGEAQTNAIWSQDLPRTLLREPVRGQVITQPNNARNGNSPFWNPPVQAAAPVATRLSTRSDPAAQPLRQDVAQKPAWVRVAVYHARDDARRTAQALARQGLAMRLGTMTQRGEVLSVVLAGPFGSLQQVDAALARLRGAGFGRAAILR